MGSFAPAGAAPADASVDEQAEALEPDVALGRPPSRSPLPEDGDVEVRRLEELRPVPPRRPRSRPGTVLPLAPEDRLPVYDPFTVRRRRAPEWLIGYTALLVAIDVLAVLVAVCLAIGAPLPGTMPNLAFAAVIACGWPVLQALAGTYAERLYGTGSDEYRRVLCAGVALLAALGFIAALLPGVGLGRLLLMDPVAVVLALIGRMAARRRLHRARRRGLMTKRLVVVGSVTAVADLVRRVRRDTDAGLRVVGACVPRAADAGSLVGLGVPLLTDLDHVLGALDDARADAVLVASGTETAAGYLRDLAWRLEGTNIELLVGPGMIEVAPNRLQVRPTTTVPLIRIQEPEFRGIRRLIKALFDRVGAAVLLVLATPVAVAIAVVIRVTSPGPVLYRHRRIGKRGREFDLLKFRSMVVDAPPDIAILGLNEGNAVQFKVKCDPRTTPVGRFLRRYSLDELPQLLNVLKGDMSLVGPRPHVTREVEQYGPDTHRRLLVKPGITGLWQVSGRSDLSWSESVELDIRYVENWSIGLDLIILLQTLRAVIRTSGAY
jgi:exopolysaccharide biosynthesis polyprenyl glycosylphosphotransferase